MLDSKKNVIFLVSGSKCEILNQCVGLKASLISIFEFSYWFWKLVEKRVLIG